MVAARSRDGTVECFDVTENEHRDHILKMSRVPAKVAGAAWRRRRARSPRASPRPSIMSACWRWKCSWSARSARALLVNEIAPRVHNSGHWTIDGATVLAVRAAYPRGRRLAARQTAAARQRVEMTNLIGAEVNDASKLADRAGRLLASLRQGRGTTAAARWGTSRACGRGARTKSSRRRISEHLSSTCHAGVTPDSERWAAAPAGCGHGSKTGSDLSRALARQRRGRGSYPSRPAEDGRDLRFARPEATIGVRLRKPDGAGAKKTAGPALVDSLAHFC